MYENEMRCPHCNKLMGKTRASEKSIAKVSLVVPKKKQPKSETFESLCPKCKNKVYITLGFID